MFVEVKTRTGSGFGSPAESVTRGKQRKLQQLAAAYARRARYRDGYRIDVLSVTAPRDAPPRIEHIKDAVRD